MPYMILSGNVRPTLDGLAVPHRTVETSYPEEVQRYCFSYINPPLSCFLLVDTIKHRNDSVLYSFVFSRIYTRTRFVLLLAMT